MNKDKLKLWVDALRSGEFKQGHEVLSSIREGERKYCCLGVACEVAIRDGLNLTVAEYSETAVAYDGATAYLPPQVAAWLGLESGQDDVYVSTDVLKQVQSSQGQPLMTFGQVEPATGLNDGLAFTFDMIAECLEKEYLSES